MTGTALAREAAAERLLAAQGIIGARVSSAGHEHEIAAIRAEPGHFAQIQQLSAELKALGFRYIAIDIGGLE